MVATYTGTKPTRMDEFQEDYTLVVAAAIDADVARTADRVLVNLANLEPLVQEFAVNQLVHACQTAARAERAGEDLDVVVGSLCHDMAKTITNANHGGAAAELIRPFVSDDVFWMVKYHQDFQGKHYYELLGLDPNAREAHAGHPAYDLTARFADEYDQVAFDPAYDTPPLEHFEPMVREVFGRKPRRAE
jgi:predicted HD phosphohydrolase